MDLDEFSEGCVPAGAELSAAQERFRSELQCTAQSMLSPGAAPGAVRTYDTGPHAVAPWIVGKLGPPVRPMWE